jgi:DNA-binding response OmpR family regulator
MHTKTINLLLIEDDYQDVALVRETLSASKPTLFNLEHADSLSAGIELISTVEIHLVLLDMGLPDSQGIHTLQKLRSAVPDLPVIVLTGLDDEVLGIKLLQMGAQDYIVKGNIDRQILNRSIRYAIERQNLWMQLEREHQKNADTQEMHSLERIKGFQIPSTTAKLLGQATLRESLPEIFEELTHAYADLLDRALEHRFYKVAYDISEEIRNMADKLGFLKACPRDVVEIHTKALKTKTFENNLQKSSVYKAEARMVLLELMGDLLSYYRTYALAK